MFTSLDTALTFAHLACNCIVVFARSMHFLVSLRYVMYSWIYVFYWLKEWSTFRSYPPRITLWTNTYDNEQWDIPESPFQSCEYTCTVATDHDSYTSAAMVVFDCTGDMSYRPPTRHPDQIYTVYCGQPPTAADLNPFTNLANWTATYRRDSQLYTPFAQLVSRKLGPGVPHIYGEELSRPKVGQHRTEIDGPEVDHYVPKIGFADKRYSVAWYADKCVSDSGRELYVRTLSRYIDVHVYGRCGNYTCPDAGACMVHFENNYKFYLSFEESACQDYVTEEFFNPLKYDIIPIVYGGATYRYHAPDHSFINVLDFESPPHLANFLRRMSGAEYEAHFRWKRDWSVVGGGLRWLLCQACKSLHEQSERKTAWDISSWWRKEGVCNNKEISRHLQ